ncbi:MAG: enoyl-CoA hydratase/isomerase family protein [Elusimicrobia bacterium]|nr:enoyl-CoA hydratase/isomerase family protein [Elusimicrobiota bacterium]
MPVETASFVGKEKIGTVCVLRMNRPPSNNLNVDFLRQLRGLFREAAQDRDTRCLLLASALPKYFSAGMDIDAIINLPLERRFEPFGELLDLYREITLFPKPSIAAINGYAFLGGWIMAMGFDFRYLAQENGKIALSEIKMGISPTTMLIRAMTAMAAKQSLVKEMVFTGKTLLAQEALDGGFVDKLIPKDSLHEESLREAQRLAELPMHAYAMVKKSYKEALLGNLEADIKKSKEEFLSLISGPEAQEGFKAMQEKRRPKFI